MASITSDSELMWNVLPAVSLPAHSKFLAVRDRNNNPMVFGIGSDHEFHVAQEVPTTRLRQLVPLSECFGLPANTQTIDFDLKQGTDDKIYLSFAVNDSGQPRLFVVEPFHPGQTDFTNPSTRLKKLEASRLDNMEVHAVLLGELGTDAKFPTLILQYRNTKRNIENLMHFEVLEGFQSLENKGDLSLPVDTNSIKQYSAGRISTRSRTIFGIFALYNQGTSPGLIFSAYSTQFDSTILCPKSASSISTFVNDKGDTDLLVGGDGLWHYNALDMRTRDADGQLLCDGPFFKGIKQIHVAQAKSKVCAWVVTNVDGVSYLDFSATAIPGPKTANETRGVPLLPAGQGSHLAGFLSSEGRNAVLVMDGKSNVTYLEQALDTSEWKKTPYWFPSSTNTVKLYSFMTRVTVLDEMKRPIPSATLTLTSSGMTDVVVNGLPCVLATYPTTLTADTAGAISIINPATDLSSYQYIVSEIKDTLGKPIALSKPIPINPMAKVEQALSGMTKEKLSAATLEDGTPVFKNSSSTELEAAAEQLKLIEDARRDLVTPKPSANNSVAPKSGASVRVSALTTGSGFFGSIKQGLWAIWHYIQNAFEQVKTWSIQVIDGIKNFVVDLAGKSYNFILNTVDRIGKAVSFIYQTYLKKPLEDLVNWFRNLFSWGDIVETKNNVVDFLNAAFDYADTNISWTAVKVDEGFEKLQKSVTEKLSPQNIPSNVQNKVVGSKSQDSASKGDHEKLNNSSVKQNWVNYQLSHGGAIKGTTLVDEVSGGVFNSLQKTWQDLVLPMFETLQQHSSVLMQDIMMLFKDNPGITTKDVLQKIGVDIILTFLDTIRTLLKGILLRIADFVKDFKQLLNKQVKVPIFSDLWVMAHKIFGKDVAPPTFSVIGFLGFLIAIPVTITCKLFTDKKPPALPKMNAITLQKFFDGSASKQDQLSFNGMCGMVETASASMLAVVGLVSAAGVGGGALLAKFVDFELVFGLIRVAVTWPTKKDLPLWEVRRAIWAADAVNVVVLAISRKVDAGGKAEKVVAGVEGGIAILNIGLNMAVNISEFTETWNEKDEERTGYQILISFLGGASTIGKNVSVIASDPYVKLGGVVTKQVAGKAAGFFNVINTYTNVGKGKYVAVLNSGS